MMSRLLLALRAADASNHSEYPTDDTEMDSVVFVHTISEGSLVDDDVVMDGVNFTI